MAITVTSSHPRILPLWRDVWRMVWRNLLPRLSHSKKTLDDSLATAKRLMTEESVIDRMRFLQDSNPHKLRHICKTAQRALSITQQAGCPNSLQQNVYRLTFVATLHSVAALDLNSFNREASPEFKKSFDLICAAYASIKAGEPKFFRLRYTELLTIAVLFHKDIRQAIKQQQAPHAPFNVTFTALRDRYRKKRFADNTAPIEVYAKTEAAVISMLRQQLALLHAPRSPKQPNARRHPNNLTLNTPMV